jgi:hypothetical protein
MFAHTFQLHWRNPGSYEGELFFEGLTGKRDLEIMLLFVRAGALFVVRGEVHK